MAEFVNSPVWNLLQRAWAHLAAHPEDIVWAGFFALLFALIFDVLDSNGRVRTGIRHIKNKRSERSAAKLRKRIEALEVRRDTIASYLTSDKALYLTVLRIVLVMLVAIASGEGVTVLGGALGMGPLLPLSLFFYGLAVLGGIQGLKTTELDNRAKVTETIAQLDSEIADLKTKVPAVKK
jgi:hypothetical protein